MASANSPLAIQTPYPDNMQRRRLNFMALTWAVLATAVLGALALAAHQTPYFSFDLKITRAVQAYRAEWLSQFMHIISWPNFPPQIDILVGLIFIGLFFAYSRWGAFAFGFASIGIAAVQLGLKILVNRSRPSPDLVHVVDPSLIGGGVGLTFPAGHPASVVAIFGFLGYLAYTTWKPSYWRSLCLIGLSIFIALVGYSRIYEGGHWFSDVVGGYLLGSVWLIISIYFYEWGKARFFLRRK